MGKKFISGNFCDECITDRMACSRRILSLVVNVVRSLVI